MSKQKTILILLGGTSAINASLTLVNSLVERGYRIVYMSAARFRGHVEKLGFAFQAFSFMDVANREKGPDKAGNWIERYRVWNRQRFVTRDRLFDWADQWLDEIRPDLLLLDSNLYSYSVPFLKKNIPIINLSTTLANFYSPVRPPVFSGLFPPGNLLSSLPVRSAWTKIFLDQHLRELREKIALRIGFGAGKARTTATMVRSLGGVLKRCEYGLRLTGPEIVLGPNGIDFPGFDKQPLRYCAGACVDGSRKEDDFDYSCLDEQKPLIYCSVGAASHRYPHAGNLYRALFGAMRQLPDYELVLQIGGQDYPKEDGQIPSNVKLFKRTPQLSLLKKAVLLITHGGFSSVREGIFYGVPMLVFPGWHDQPGNAARVVYHGLGERGSMKTVSAVSLLTMIKRVLHDNAIRSSIRDMQKQIRQEDGLGNSMKLIEQLIPQLSTAKVKPAG